MIELNFHFDLLERRKCLPGSNVELVPRYNINEEWKATCLWTQYGPTYSRPGFLKLERESTAEEIFLSGAFKLFRGEKCLLNRKFGQLLDTGCKTAIIEFGAYNDDFSRDPLSISGNLRIPSALGKRDMESLFLLSSDYERLRADERAPLSDVKFKCGAESFSAHKIILSARSPVFRAMFTTYMTENLNNQVEITDISPQNFRVLLSYIYSGETGQLTFDSVEGLLFAGDKYELLELKRKCSEFLKSSVSTENALNVLVLGYLHDDELKTFALEFIYKNITVLEKKEDFINLSECYSSLYLDILKFVGKSRREERMTYLKTSTNEFRI
ncbi:Speckle-type POZ protein like [Argiope bruennichi]|uniref:Speckle-type POZ protein like n=1 Tax=Argiope bruennichi TaxID=94029 RepID=A0A8T0F8K3_ARGBR|nr:Speckle-type POZ protein like [Argiope bruennichi]